MTIIIFWICIAVFVVMLLIPDDKQDSVIQEGFIQQKLGTRPEESRQLDSKGQGSKNLGIKTKEKL